MVLVAIARRKAKKARGTEQAGSIADRMEGSGIESIGMKTPQGGSTCKSSIILSVMR